MPNSLDIYVMSDLHLNNIVMNVNNDGFLLIHTILEMISLMNSTYKLDFTKSLEEVPREFG